MLELIGVSKSFGEVGALKKTDLSIPEARITVLIGPSGCGKSTMLRLMLGLIRPDSGTVKFDGAEITSTNIRDLRRRMGYVIQDGGLFPHLTARRNVTLIAGFLGWDSRRIDSRLDELRELTQFPVDGLERFPAQLSGGQRQRVSLMRALMLDPKLLLLDEPLGALDPMIRSELQTDLREIFQKLGKTVVMVTHDLGEAVYFGNEIVLMQDGGIVQKGEFKDLVNAPAHPFVTKFINAQRSAVGVAGGN